MMDENVIVTYYIETEKDLGTVARKMAFEETTGGWSSTDESTKRKSSKKRK